MANFNVSSPDWDSLSAEDQNAIASVMSTATGMNAVASPGGISVSGEMPTHLAGGDTSTVEAGAFGTVLEYACKAGCTVAEVAMVAACVANVELSPVGQAACALLASKMGDACRDAC